jgi:predicted nucleic acid binding AN1-type Zn finger protein
MDNTDKNSCPTNDVTNIMVVNSKSDVTSDVTLDVTSSVMSTETSSVTPKMKKHKSRCTFVGCNKKIHIMGYECRYCKTRFCIKHYSVESHLCKNMTRCRSEQQYNQKEALMKDKVETNKMLKV